MRKIVPVVIFVYLVISIAGCSKPEKKELKIGTKKIVIYTTFYPTCEFSRIIGGDHVEVINPVPEDADPIFWMPPREVIKDYQEKADIIVINGAGYEKWVKKVVLPESIIVNTAEPFEGNLISIEGAVTHSHGVAVSSTTIDKGNHSHKGIDGHTWMDPVLAKIQAGVIRDALIEIDSLNEEEYKNNYNKLCKRLDRLDDMFKELSKRYKGKMLTASHPAYNYIARRYGWNLESFYFDPEELPSKDSLENYEKFINTNKVKYIIWESYPSKQVEEHFLNAFGIKSIEFSPIEVLSEVDISRGKDYFSIMEQNIRNLEVLF